MVVLTLQTRVAEQDGRALHTLNAIERAREAFIRRLFVRDGPPIWSAELWSDSAQNLVAQSHHSFSRQVQALRGYVERKGGSFVLQAVLFLAIFVRPGLGGPASPAEAGRRRGEPCRAGVLTPRRDGAGARPAGEQLDLPRRRHGCSGPFPAPRR